MQRIALGVCAGAALAALLAGCESAQPARSDLGEPVFATGRRWPMPPANPLPQPREPAPRTPATARGFDPAVLRPSTPIARGRWQVIVVHHSASEVDSPASMDNFHRNSRGWDRGLGYHFVIGNGVNYPDGQVFAGQRWRLQETGAHCKAGAGRYFGVQRPSNDNGIGICLIGDFQTGRPTARQLQTLTALVEHLCAQTGIPAGRVYGHGEVTKQTVCPGTNLRRSLVQVRREVAAALATSGRSPLAEQATGGQLGFERYHAALSYAQLHDAGSRSDHPAKRIHAAYGLVADRLDHVTRPHLLIALAGGDRLEYHDALGLRVQSEALADWAAQIGYAQAAPQQRLAAHPPDATDLAPFDPRFDAQALAVTHDLHDDRRTNGRRADGLDELRRAGHRRVAERRDDVAEADACPRCRALGLDARDDDPDVLGQMRLRALAAVGQPRR
jgi:hypothetical protein